MSRRYLLVANPTAQSGQAEARIARAVRRIEARGHSLRLLPTEPGDRTVTLVKEAIDGDSFDGVIYLGGDGTFAQVAKGILAAAQPLPLGMLPSGTANDQGRSFGISSHEDDLDRNLEILDAGHLTHLDVGRVGRVGADGRIDALEQVFHSVGWGIQPEILSERNRDRKWVEQIPLVRDLYRDQAVYAGAAVKRTLASWVEPTKFDVQIIADGEGHSCEGLTDLVINATPVYGGAWVLDRDAEPDDGRFEVVPIAGRRDWAGRAIRDLAQSPIDQDEIASLVVPRVQGFSATEVELQFRRPQRTEIASQVDGEQWVCGHHFRLTVLARALPIITPKGFEPPWRS
jgi:diacylglycerol kinase family enzyme